MSVVKRRGIGGRFARIAFAFVVGAGVAGCTSSVKDDSREASTTQPTARTGSDRNVRMTRPPLGHARVTLDADALRSGHFKGTRFDDARGGITLNKPGADFPFTGTWQSETIQPKQPFIELLPSWNITLPADAADRAGLRFDVRVRDAKTGAWSPWLYIGYWGRVLRDHRTIRFDSGKVDTDTLELDRPADAYEIRATVYDFRTNLTDEPSPAVLKRVDIVSSHDRTTEDRADEKEADPTTEPATQPAWKPTLIDVPFRAQGVEAESIRGSVCSPTSVSMVLQWAGTNRPTQDNCMAIWDDDYAIFGNWNRAVAFASSLGHESYLERFTSMDEARKVLSSGQPIIASIRFKRGEFPSNLQKRTAGHLIVLRGIDEHGDIIVNDPASKDRGEKVVYKANELAVAWLKNTGGVGYIIKKK